MQDSNLYRPFLLIEAVYVYMAALRAVILDRHDALTGQNTYRTKAEVRHLKGLAEQGEGHNPELMLSVLSIREKLKPSEEMGSIRSILSELRTLATTLQFQIDKGNKRTAAELTLVEKQLEHTRTLSMNQAKALTGLERFASETAFRIAGLITRNRELDLFTNTQNARLEYYKQLQHISVCIPFYRLGTWEVIKLMLARIPWRLLTMKVVKTMT